MLKFAITLLGFVSWAVSPILGQQYVGSQACATCHQKLYDHWVRSAMGRSMTPASQHLHLTPATTEVPAEKFNRTFSVYADNGQLKQREQGPAFRHEQPLAWAIGSGVNGLSFVLQRGDHLFQAPLSYYAKANKWELSPGYEFADYGFNRPIAAACIQCHSGRPNAIAGTNGKYAAQPFQELAIGCENCHGPGQAHIAQRGAAKAIVNPARLPAARADEICMNCHQTGDTRILQPGKTERDFRPGMPLNDIVAIFKLPRDKNNPSDADLLEHHESMRLSQCFAKSQNMSCQSCHNPHAEKTDYNAKCASCHQPFLRALTTASTTVSTTASNHPPRTSNCVECHMPKRAVGIIAHSALTNHRIVRKPDQPLPARAFAKPGQELVHLNPNGDLPLPLLTRMQAYGQLADRNPLYLQRFQELLDEAARKQPKHPLVLASLGRRALRAKQYAEAIPLLQQAFANGSTSATTYEDLGEAFGRAGRLDEAVVTLQNGLKVAPFSQVLYKALALRLIQAKRYEEAKATLTQYVELFPEDDFVRNLLNQVSGTR